jgi:hypothetical protein
MSRLRSDRKHRTHHVTSFRTGVLLGLAFPAFVDGLVRSKFLLACELQFWLIRSFLGLQPEIRTLIPGWDGLLYVYGILVIPVLFACLIGLNIAAWARSRINYIFIFGELMGSMAVSYTI